MTNRSIALRMIMMPRKMRDFFIGKAAFQAFIKIMKVNSLLYNLRDDETIG